MSNRRKVKPSRVSATLVNPPGVAEWFAREVDTLVGMIPAGYRAVPFAEAYTPRTAEERFADEVAAFRPWRCVECFMMECACEACACDFCASAVECEACHGKGWHREGCERMS